ncbi:hypothetical protein [Oryzomicrobium sp.]|uniref:hypothetical protein n=1 Tax=Oryzomicrobium sp. TaxID=1911578 RepID=UPI002FDF1F17
MNKRLEPIALDPILMRTALDRWLAECERRMSLRFPKIDFLENAWPLRTLYQTEQLDWYFTAPMADFSEKDICYGDALRCLVAEMVIAGKPKQLHEPVAAFRQLSKDSPHRFFDLALDDLRRLEERLLAHGKANPQSANAMRGQLIMLSQFMTQLSRNGVLPMLGWRAYASTMAELSKVRDVHSAKKCEGKGERLDRCMEAFNQAFNKMVEGAPELSARDRVALSAGVILLCAPSRMNEPLCMSIDDHVAVEDYAQNTIGELDGTHRAHQMLIITMKGSKGAQWSPKPVLSFMIDAFYFATDIIKSHGKRSRMLVEWYQQHPDILYLPPELEHLRGQAVSRRNLGRIIRLDANLPDGGCIQSANNYFKELRDCQFKAPNPVFVSVTEGRGVARWKNIDYLPWVDVEALLLKKVREALNRCRRVTSRNPYQGDLAKMLFLFDDDELPAFLPSTTTYYTIKSCFKVTESQRRARQRLSLFEKLKITMPVDGVIRIAEMDTHDPRRWLTTMALTYGEKLSDVLINKWANRSKLSQLKAYDFRSAEAIAAAASMPKAEKLTELADLSNGLAAVEKLEEQFSLQTTIVTAHDAGVAVTSLDAVIQAVEDRPVARTSRGIIIIYPQKYGICLHQHHEKPCRNYSNELSASCLTCDEAVQQKGHIPTNEAVRNDNKRLFSIIVYHLENLALTYNRNVADDPAMLGEHMLTLVEKGLSPLGIEQLANELIDNFQEANRLLKDRRLANLLEQGFVARESVKILDDTTKLSGALFKYHNPTRHSEPLMEVALGEHGGREQVARDEQALVSKYPQFAPTPDNITDERHLVAADNDEED